MRGDTQPQSAVECPHPYKCGWVPPPYKQYVIYRGGPLNRRSDYRHKKAKTGANIGKKPYLTTYKEGAPKFMKNTKYCGATPRNFDPMWLYLFFFESGGGVLKKYIIRTFYGQAEVWILAKNPTWPLIKGGGTPRIWKNTKYWLQQPEISIIFGCNRFFRILEGGVLKK